LRLWQTPPTAFPAFAPGGRRWPFHS
jgi:hypothetical protein